MSDTMNLSEMLNQLGAADSVTSLLTARNGELQKVTMRPLANFAFGTVARDEDLDNPTTRGVFSVSEATITAPTKGTGWQYGFVLNLAQATGIQIWINFSGYIAVRGKGSAGTPWSEWKVMQQMA